MSTGKSAATSAPGPDSFGVRFRHHLSLARISNSPTVVSNVLAGTALATALTLTDTVVVMAIAMVLFYTAGMYLNDLFDLEWDRARNAARPLPSGAVSVREALAAIIGFTVVGLILLALTTWWAFASGIVLLGVIVAYDRWHKGNPLSPLFMAATRILVYVTAFLAFSTDLTWELGAWCLLLLLYVAGLTSIAKTEHGNGTTRYWPVVALFLPAVFALIRQPTVGTVALVLLFVAWVVYACSFVFRRDGKSIGGAIGRLIAGIALVDALVLASVDSAWGVIIALVAFAGTFVFQRYIKGT